MSNRIAIGDFYLLDKIPNKFEIKQLNYIENGYDRVSKLYKSCGGVFDKGTRKWVIPLSRHDVLVEKANEINDIITFKPLKKEHLNIYLYAYDNQNFQINCNYKENDFLSMLDEERVHYQMEEDRAIVEYKHYDLIVNKIVRKYINTDLHTIPKGVIESVKSPAVDINNNHLGMEQLRRTLHSSLVDVLKDFQLEGILHAIHKNARLM